MIANTAVVLTLLGKVVVVVAAILAVTPGIMVAHGVLVAVAVPIPRVVPVPITQTVVTITVPIPVISITEAVVVVALSVPETVVPIPVAVPVISITEAVVAVSVPIPRVVPVPITQTVVAITVPIPVISIAEAVVPISVAKAIVAVAVSVSVAETVVPIPVAVPDAVVPVTEALVPFLRAHALKPVDAFRQLFAVDAFVGPAANDLAQTAAERRRARRTGHARVRQGLPEIGPSRERRPIVGPNCSTESKDCHHCQNGA
jgi:hypothetical protein